MLAARRWEPRARPQRALVSQMGTQGRVMGTCGVHGTQHEGLGPDDLSAKLGVPLPPCAAPEVQQRDGQHSAGAALSPDGKRNLQVCLVRSVGRLASVSHLCCLRTKPGNQESLPRSANSASLAHVPMLQLQDLHSQLTALAQQGAVTLGLNPNAGGPNPARPATSGAVPAEPQRSPSPPRGGAGARQGGSPFRRSFSLASWARSSSPRSPAGAVGEDVRWMIAFA